MTSPSSSASPQVSVIVACFNVGPFVEQCVESLLRQTMTDLEVLAIDDGSTDDTGMRLARLAEQDARLTVLTQSNAGVSAARNFGLRHARGATVLFVDGDDWVEPETCTELLSSMQRENADVVMCSYVREFRSGSHPRVILGSQARVFDAAEVRAELLPRLFGPSDEHARDPGAMDILATVWGKLYARSLLAGLEFEQLRFEDGIFNIHAFRRSPRAAYHPGLLYHYRKTNTDSLTRKPDPTFRHRMATMFDRLDALASADADAATMKHRVANRRGLSVLGTCLIEVSGRRPRAVKVAAVRAVLEDPPFRSGLQQLPLATLPVHWRLYYWLALKQRAVAVYALTASISRVLSR